MKTYEQTNKVLFYNTELDPNRLVNKVLKKILKKTLEFEDRYEDSYYDHGRPWIK